MLRNIFTGDPVVPVEYFVSSVLHFAMLAYVFFIQIILVHPDTMMLVPRAMINVPCPMNKQKH